MKKIILIALGCFALAGCATTNSAQINTNGNINKRERTINIPANNGVLLMDLQRSLKTNGWKTYVNNGQSRYTLALDEDDSKVDFLMNADCAGKGSLVVYDLSILDNQTHQKVLSMANSTCYKQATQNIIQTIRSIER